MAEQNTLLSVEDFVEEVQTETEQDTFFPSTRSRVAKAFAVVLLAVAVVVCLVPSPLATSALAGLQEKWEWPARGKCLCLFDVDRTLTSRQLQNDAATDEQCPKTEYAREVDGKAVIDFAYKGGRLRLSEVAFNMKDTFCGKQNCYMGLISAGGASGDDEKEIIIELLSKAYSAERLGGPPEERFGGSSFGQFATVDSDVDLQKIGFTPDPQKGDVAKNIFDWLNSDTGKKAGVPANKVWLFDDHLGNAAEMGKYGFNGREVSCKTRDQSIGNGLVGLCGAELSEIVPSEGISTCADPK